MSIKENTGNSHSPIIPNHSNKTLNFKAFTLILPLLNLSSCNSAGSQTCLLHKVRLQH